ncbi:facilitated trehalose transporter Tret1-like [Musca autumnalis]|uniref:facilitated trehalose transporter Tret1-like n=1 Tax=Musca autumnalis TaxID=221902 RepID=UPI003CED8A6B
MSSPTTSVAPHGFYTTPSERIKKSKPNSMSIAAGGIIFLSAGMNMALGLGWYRYSLLNSATHFCYSWFIGVIIGSILSAPLINFMPKRFILSLSTFLILIEGILFTCAPHRYGTLLAGRYFNGIGIGLAIVPYLINASEISANSNRGSCLATEQYSVSIGIALQMLYSSLWSFTVDFPINCLHGIIDIMFAVVAGVFLFYFIESPIGYIRKGEDGLALETMARLRKPQGVTGEVRSLFEQHKAYVREQDNLSMQQSLHKGILPLAKMIFYRSLMLAFCYSLPLNYALQFSIVMNGRTWAPAVAGGCRFLGSLVAICVVDYVDRKIISIMSAIIVGGLMVGLGLIFRNNANILIATDMNTAMVLCIVMQLFAGFFAPYSSMYLGEAFPLRTKPYLMDACVIIEQILHIVLIEAYTLNMGTNLFVQGIIIMVVFLLLGLTMPETRKTSLAEAQRRFRKWLYIKLDIEF